MSLSGWGSPDKYYSDPEPAVFAKATREIGAPWLSILESCAPRAQQRVRAAVSDWGPSIREQLRIETALRLTTLEQRISVPVRVSDGIPPPLSRLRELPLATFRLMLMRGRISSTVLGVRLVRERFEDVEQFFTECQSKVSVPGGKDDVHRVENLLEVLADELGRLSTVEQLWREPVDWLGAYFFRKPAVEIYWIPIAITAGLCDVEVEALTYVVLAHELAHAYTHVGQDIDGHSWDTTDFAVADPYIVEGLAQYYTQILCGRVEQRYPAALEAFLALLARQSGPYSDFGTWNLEVRDPGEHMRRSMLSARRLGMRDYGVFQALIHGGLDR